MSGCVRSALTWLLAVVVASTMLLAQAAAAPDLVVSSFLVTPEPAGLGCNATVAIRVRNQGPDPAGPYTLAFFVHSALPPAVPFLADMSWGCPPLGPGEETPPATWAFTPAAPGSYRAWAWADSWDDVPESDETNNQQSRDYSVWCDLVVSSLTLTPDVLSLGQQTTAAVIVHNQGVFTAGPFAIGFWRHSASEPSLPYSRDYQWQRQGLEGRADTPPLTWDFTPTRPGSFRAWAWADSYDAVEEEEDESNNQRSRDYLVTAPDLVISSVDIVPDPSVLGQGLAATVVVKNQGGAYAGRFMTGFWEHSATEPTAPFSSDHAWEVLGLAPGAESAPLSYGFTPTGPGSFRARAWADKLNEIAEQDESNNTRSRDYTVTAADLVISSIEIAPDPAVLGQQLQALVVAKNQGGAPAGPFVVGFWQDSATAPTAPFSCDHAWDVPGLGPGAESPALPCDFTPTSPGSFRAWAWADKLNEIAEQDESNNTRSHDYTVTAPDLVISSINIAPDPSNLGQGLTAFVKAKNRGAATAGSFVVGFWQHAPSAPVNPYTYDHEWFVGSLDPGIETPVLPYDFTPSRAGSFRAWAWADNRGWVTEEDETDNQRSSNYTVTAPDLVVSSLSVAPDPSALGTLLTATVRARNIGDAPAGAFSVAFWGHRTAAPTDEPGAATIWPVPGLPPGEETPDLVCPFAPMAPGEYQAWAWVDSGKTIAESDESNNTANRPYRVDTVDLVVSELTLAPDPSNLGTRLSATIRGKNQGTQEARGFRISFWQHCAAAPLDGTGEDAGWVVDSLAPGEETARFTHEFTPPAAGSYRAWALVDSGNTVAESREDNNAASCGYAVCDTDLVVSYLAITPDPSALGTQLTASVRGTNQGTTAAGPFSLDLWQHRVSAPSDAPGSNRHWSFSGLAGNTEPPTKTHQFVPATAGTYKAWALVDSGHAVSETDETNNTGNDRYVVKLALQPDGWIRARGQLPWVGDNIWNGTGLGQEAQRTIEVGETAVYLVCWQNDGNVRDGVTVTGPGSSGPWTVTYFDAWSGGNDITSQVTGTGWQSPDLRPQGTCQMRVLVRADSRADSGMEMVVRLTGRSRTQPLKKDVVKATTTVR